MHKDLIIHAFNKTKAQLEKKGVLNPSTNKQAEFLSSYLVDCHFQYSSRSLRELWRDAQHQGRNVNIKKQEVIQHLVSYLGYQSYKHFQLGEPMDAEKSSSFTASIVQDSTLNEPELQNKAVKIYGVMSLLGSLVLHAANREVKQRWMTWNGDRFIEVDFDRKLYKNGNLELWDAHRFRNFKKVKIDNDISFFSESGNPLVWYHKLENGRVEYFAHTGKHPVDKKYIRPITKYIIEKYSA